MHHSWGLINALLFAACALLLELRNKAAHIPCRIGLFTVSFALPAVGVGDSPRRHTPPPYDSGSRFGAMTYNRSAVQER